MSRVRSASRDSQHDLRPLFQKHNNKGSQGRACSEAGNEARAPGRGLPLQCLSLQAEPFILPVLVEHVVRAPALLERQHLALSTPAWFVIHLIKDNALHCMQSGMSAASTG